MAHIPIRFPKRQKKYFDFLQDAWIFLVRQILGISQKVRLTNPIIPNSYSVLFPKNTAILFTDTRHNSCAIRRNRKYWRDTFRKVNFLFLFIKNLLFSLPKAS